MRVCVFSEEQNEKMQRFKMLKCVFPSLATDVLTLRHKVCVVALAASMPLLPLLMLLSVLHKQRELPPPSSHVEHSSM